MLFTPEEIMVLFVIGFIIISIIVFIIKKMFLAAISVCLAIFLFGFGFGWLPEQIDSVKNGEKTSEEVINDAFTTDTLYNSFNEASDYYQQNKDGIWNTVSGTFDKLYHLISP